MNEFERLHRLAEQIKKNYPEGTRIKLLHMGDDPRPIEDNMRGAVDFVDDIGTVHCTFDNGRRLGLIWGEDSFRKLTEAELAEEKQEKAMLDDQIESACSEANASFMGSTSKEKNQVL